MIFFAIFLIAGVFALCNETQIDINSASAEELDKITNVGPAIAERIIETRPFSSVDDLIRVSGIGEITLNEIKEQELACVSEEALPEEQDEEENLSEDKEKQTDEEQEEKDESPAKEENENKSPEPIMLNPSNSSNSKSIKSKNDKEILTRNLAITGIVIICLVFGALFLLKARKRKNEFR